MSAEPARMKAIQVPGRIADLGFSVSIPTDFHQVDLPAEQPTFENPIYMFPLFVCMARYGAVVFAAAARPAYDNGSVQEWAMYLTQTQGMKLESASATIINGQHAVILNLTQETEAGPMRSRVAAMEDGKRFIALTIMAPEQVWPSVEPLLSATLMSFRLDSPKGPSMSLTPGGPVPESFTPEAIAGSVDAQPSHPRDVAIAYDAASLDSEHPMNVRLRENGVGLVPRVLETNTDDRFALIGAGAIEAIFKIPFGWHAIDDGKRTLVFDEAGKVQLNLSLRPTPQGARVMIADLLAEHLAQQPDIQHITLELCGMPCLAFRNYRVNAEVLEQAFLVKDVGREGMSVVARITATGEDMERAMNLAEVVLRDLKTAA